MGPISWLRFLPLVRPRCVRSTCKQSQVKAKSAVHKMHLLTGWKIYSEHRYNIIIQHTLHPISRTVIPGLSFNNVLYTFTICTFSPLVKPFPRTCFLTGDIRFYFHGAELFNIKVCAYQFHSQHMATFSYNYTIKRNKDKLLILL